MSEIVEMVQFMIHLVQFNSGQVGSTVIEEKNVSRLTHGYIFVELVGC